MSATEPSFRLGCFRKAGGPPFVGVVLNERVTPLSQLQAGYTSGTTMIDLLQDWSESMGRLKVSVARGLEDGFPVKSLEACAPVPKAPQVFCTGTNYASHVVQMMIAVGLSPDTDAMNAEQRRAYGEAYVARQKVESSPYVFMKPSTAISGPNDPLVLPSYSAKSDWELELGAVIGRPAYRVSRADALSYVAGYMVVNDMTARDKVFRKDPGAFGPDWVASKGAPGFLPTGPYLVPAEFIPDPYALRMQLWLNGETMQDDYTRNMTFDIARQIEFVSTYARMLPGDILCTGTPGGNGVTRGRFLRQGDLMEAEIEGLGRQSVRCMQQQ